MSLDEKLFYYLWKFRKEMTKEAVPSYACSFEQMEDRLGILSSLLAKKLIKVKRGKRLGGLVGDTLFYPPSIYISKDSHLNQLAYIHHACFALTAQELGFNLKYNAVTGFTRLLASLVAAPTILQHMKKRFPALYAGSQQLYDLYSSPDSPYRARTDNLVTSRIQSLSLDILTHLTSGQFSKDSVFVKAQQHLLTGPEVIRLSQQLESGFSETKLNSPLIIPPFFSLLPLDGLLQIHKEEATVEDIATGNTPETTIKTDPKDIVKRVDLTEDENYNPASILIEAVQSVDLFSGGLKRVDGSDELNEHQEGLQDLDVSEVVRTNKETKSVFQADIAYEVITDESKRVDLTENPGGFFYPEWDYKKKQYLKNWCLLYENPPEPKIDDLATQHFLSTAKTEYAPQIKNLRHQIEKITFSRRWKNRQLRGEDIDIDALIDALASIKGGKSPNENLYLSKPKQNKDVAVLVLLDASLSSDSWVDGHRVLDVSKEAIVIIQEALAGVFENIAVMAFNSQTRRKIAYYSIKEFGASWPSSVKNLLAIEPSGYTRIGTALRHSLYKINRVKAAKKAVILISDGKPTDYDVYEGKYGIQDVRQAVREARQKDIHIMSLAIDQQAKYYFPQMFGKNNFRVLKHPKFLANQFMDLFCRMI